MAETQTALGRLVPEALASLEQRRQAPIAVEQLERRQERIRTEMRTSFAGASQELAIRVQGFKDYLTGSLQDLAAAAEQLELCQGERRTNKASCKGPNQLKRHPQLQFAEPRFQSTKSKFASD